MEIIGQTSDGYHTFDELYEHRHALFIALCHLLLDVDSNIQPWKSRVHSDGTMFDGWFIAGLVNTEYHRDSQISYHLPMRLWDRLMVPEKEAPVFDGHTSEDVIERLYRFFRMN